MIRIRTRMYQQSPGRHAVYLPTVLVFDSQFPFQPGEKITATVRGRTVVLESTGEPFPKPEYRPKGRRRRHDENLCVNCGEPVEDA